MGNISTDLNMANRQCCDLDIRDYKTKAPWMFADFCNTTTANISADAVYANKKGKTIEGTVADKKFTAKTTSDIVADTTYEVAYLESKATGIKKITFNNKKLPKDFFIQMSTLNKDENGDQVPMRLPAYKASPQRNFEISFASDGDPSSVTLTCDLLEDHDGNVLDMIEITSEE